MKKQEYPCYLYHKEKSPEMAINEKHEKELNGKGYEKWIKIHGKDANKPSNTESDDKGPELTKKKAAAILEKEFGYEASQLRSMRKEDAIAALAKEVEARDAKKKLMEEFDYEKENFEGLKAEDIIGIYNNEVENSAQG